KLTAF
ncbi:bifunctional protein FolD, partial [Vibrio parahaemolyticus V-223/04]